MSQIYSKDGKQVYDYNGQTIDASTGAVLGGTYAPDLGFGSGTPPQTAAPPPAPPTTGSAPTGTPGSTPAQTPPVPTTSTSPTGISDASFLGVLNGLNSGFQQNNALVDQKTIVMNALMGNPVDPAKLAALPPDIQHIIQSGDKNQLLLQAQILNDAITSKSSSVASSIQFLTTGWQTAQQRYDTEASNLLNWSKQYGIAPNKLIQTIAPDIWASMSPTEQEKFGQIGAPLVAANLVAPPGNDITTGNFTVSIPQSSNISYENNNPLDLRFANQKGATQGTHGFAKFETPEAGFQAGVQLIQTYQTGGVSVPIPDGPNAGKTVNGQSTLQDFIRVYAPTADGNDPVSYAANIASTLGVTPNTPIGQIDSVELGTAMLAQESNATITAGQEVPITPPDPATANTPNAGIATWNKVRTNNTPNDIWQGALTYGLTGKIPTLGLGSKDSVAATRSAMTSIGSGIAAKAGVDLPTIQQEWSTYKSAQQNSMKQYVQSTINSKTAESYFATAQQLGATMDKNSLETATPLINNWIRSGQTQLSGNADVNNFVSAVTEGLTEYAKVVAGQTTGQGVTIGANLQAQGLLPRGVTADMFGSWVTNVAQPMMNNRLTSFQQGIGADTPQDVLDFLTVAHGGQPGEVTLTPQAGGPPLAGASSSSTSGGGHSIQVGGMTFTVPYP